MSEPNILLESLISQAGLSHAGVAARINKELGTRYDHTAVARWIRDRATPRGKALEVLCAVLSGPLGRTVTLADIGYDRPGNRLYESDLRDVTARTVALWQKDAQRPEFLSGTALDSGPGAVVPVFEWENPPDDRDVSQQIGRAVGEPDLQRIRDARVRYERMYRQVGGVPVRPRLVSFLKDHASPILSGSFSDSTGRQLFRATGSLTALAGICAYDTDQHALAQRYFLAALRMAKASADRGFGAYVIALMANQALHQQSYRLVIQYAETALRAAHGHLTPALISDLCTLQAKAYACIGDTTACHEQMRRSEEMTERIRPAEEPSETGYVQPGLMQTQHAEVLRRLGDLSAAEQYAEEAVRTASVAHTRGQVHRHAELSLIRAGLGRIDEALEPALIMADLAVGMESGRVQDRVRSVRDALSTHSQEPAVREFSDQVDSYLDLEM